MSLILREKSHQSSYASFCYSPPSEPTQPTLLAADEQQEQLHQD
jgi:hypothetical protein